MFLDTHTLVWLDEGSSRLGKQALSLIDQSLQSKELFVSAISFWEVAMLAEKGRLEMKMSVALWRQSLLENGLQEIALSGSIAKCQPTCRIFVIFNLLCKFMGALPPNPQGIFTTVMI